MRESDLSANAPDASGTCHRQNVKGCSLRLHVTAEYQIECQGDLSSCMSVSVLASTDTLLALVVTNLAFA